MRKLKGWVIGLIVVLLIVVWGIGSYNSLVSYEQKTKASYSRFKTSFKEGLI